MNNDTDDWFTSTAATASGSSTSTSTSTISSSNNFHAYNAGNVPASIPAQQPAMGGGMSFSNPNLQQQLNAQVPSNNVPAPQKQMSDQSNDMFSGSMNNGNPSISSPDLMNGFSGNMSTSQSFNSAPSSGGYIYDPMEFENEPPLMEELGVNISHISDKTHAALLPFSTHAKNNPSLMESDDLFGPLFFALLLGGTLLLHGKLHFGYIYGFGMCGCVAMTFILNLMSPKEAISIWSIVSVLGYGLLPVNVLAFLNLFLNLKNRGMIGSILGALTILWCTAASTRLFERSCDMRDQRYLIAYPTALIYCCFVIISVF